MEVDKNCSKCKKILGETPKPPESRAKAHATSNFERFLWKWTGAQVHRWPSSFAIFRDPARPAAQTLAQTREETGSFQCKPRKIQSPRKRSGRKLQESTCCFPLSQHGFRKICARHQSWALPDERRFMYIVGVRWQGGQFFNKSRCAHG